MLSRDDLGGEERERMLGLLKILDSSFTTSGHQGGDGEHATSGVSGPSGEGRHQVRGRLRRPVHSDGSKGGAVYRCLGDQDSCEHGLVTSDVGEKGSSGGVVTDHTYIYNSTLPFQEDDVHAFK